MLQLYTETFFLLHYLLLLGRIPTIFNKKHDSMDVRVKNRKTGDEKVVPIKVFESLKHIYAKIGDVEPEQEQLKKKDEESNLPAGHAVEVTEFHPAVEVKDGKVTEIQTSTAPEIEPLTDEYTKLSGGKKPDGRWSPEKLKAKVAELKNTVTVDTDESK